MPVRPFDLNVEEVLENWNVEHAIREIIANALDEQVLTQGPSVVIAKDSRGVWHVRDFGRGLQILHFTMNESEEKLGAAGGIIGKFGVGLKDALSTFNRRDVAVRASSKFGTFSVKPSFKHGFENIVTLHVEYDDSPLQMEGTDFELKGVTDEQMARAKAMFVRFANEETLETTAYGEILRRDHGPARVYIQGVLANEEPGFLFSYNITSITEAMRKRLNRERMNVGRTFYSERIKAILKAAVAPVVEAMLVQDVERGAAGLQSEELGWIEVSQKALTLLHKSRSVVYMTDHELQLRADVIDVAHRDGVAVIRISEEQKHKLVIQANDGGPQVRVLESLIQEHNASFEYRFVDVERLTKEEQAVFGRTPQILSLVGLTPIGSPNIKISETMRTTQDDTLGVWDPALFAIVIRRSQLGSLREYAAILLHELAHATSGCSDASRDFESVLTRYLGQIAAAALRD